jgi:hypothetical protein
MSFKQYAKENNEQIDESAVGSVGRTGINDAEMYINENPALISEFKKIVVKMGGKSVARRVIDKISFSKKITESSETVEDYMRGAGYKIKKVYPSKDGSTEIELYKASSAEEAYEDLKSAGFIGDYDISFDGHKSLIVKKV